MTATYLDAERVNPTRGNPSPGVLEKMTLIIDAFLDGPERLLLEDLTEITSLPRSTVFRLLCQLVNLNWIGHAWPGYRLGPRMISASGHLPERDQLRAAAAVPLNTLHLSAKAVSHLTVIDGGLTSYLDKVGGVFFGTVPSRIGARVRVTDTVSGLAMLACMTPEEVDSTVALTRTLGDAESSELHRNLRTIRERGGIAHSPGAERRSGISSIAVAVQSPDGRPIAAVSLARKGDFSFAPTAQSLHIAARQVAQNLFPGACV